MNPADHLARFAVTGPLLEAATVRTTTRGMPLLRAVIQANPTGGLPVVATYHYPDEDAPSAAGLAAHDKARRMVAGAHVMASGAALRIGKHEGQPALVLEGVRGIALLHDLQLHTSHVKE